MSLKVKLSLIFSVVVTAILVLNATLSYVFTRDLLLQKSKSQMEFLVKTIAASIESSQHGSEYIEDMLGHELRTASIAAKYALHPDVNQVTNDELAQLSKELDVSHITLFQQQGDDIVGVKSSDPKEIQLSTKSWDYWFTAFQQLLTYHKVTVPEGQKLKYYWSGPLNIAASDPEQIDKWGYFYDGTSNYIIDPYIRTKNLTEFNQITGPEALLSKTLKDNRDYLEITGFNPAEVGKKLSPQTSTDGTEFVPLDKRPIMFGSYTYKDETKDIAAIREAAAQHHTVSFETKVNGQQVMKSFVPVQTSKPYVIGVVMNYRGIQEVLNQQLWTNVAISVILLLVVFGFSYVFSAYLLRPVFKILSKVKEISNGHFGAHIPNNRNDELGLLAGGVNKMSSNLENYKKQIEYQAYYDDLTDLPNRRLFHESLQESILQADQTGQQMAVMFFDLDRFKFVNDVFGHSIGDQLLKAFGERVTNQLRPGDRLFRIGGDEFTILLPDIAKETAASIAEGIIYAMAAPFFIQGYEIVVSTSIGISLYPGDGDTAETLLKNTDLAMYRVKEKGKNSYEFYIPEINEIFFRRIQLEKDLHRALENKEFSVYYQPQVHLKTGEIDGVEALVRWKHPTLGSISPSEFIPIAEETGLIIPIGEFVLKTACEQLRIWRDAGYQPMRIAVNLSARQFQQGNLEEYVAAVLSETGIEPEYLELEITESIAMQDSDFSIMKLKRLRQLGAFISIDDFGTGYSSLNYLRKFPIHKLKIDKSFVQEIEGDPENEIMIKTIITMAHHLKLQVIAEGVETEQQLQFLQSQQCDSVQGYYVSPPLSAEAFEDRYSSIRDAAAAKG